MPKAAIPRVPVLLLMLGALIAAGAFLSTNGFPFLPAPESEPEIDVETVPEIVAPSPARPARPNRPDADLWETWHGKPMAEILAALAPPAAEPAPDLPAIERPASAGEIDPFLPRFETVDTVRLPPADDAAALDGGVLVLSLPGRPLSVWRIGPETAEDVTAESGLGAFPGGVRLLPADFDRDGDLDLFVGRGGMAPDSLLRRTGEGSWEDITEAAGLLEFLDFADAAWVDYDRDGWLDLCVLHRPAPGGKESILRLFRYRGGGDFAEVAAAAKLTAGGDGRHLRWFDAEDDGYPDLLLSMAEQPGTVRLWRSVAKGEGRAFVEGTAEAGFDRVAGGGPIAEADLDGDGSHDLVIASEQRLSILTVSRGPETLFSHRSSEGVASPAVIASEDFDRDGVPDLFLAGGGVAAPACRAWWNPGDLGWREIPGAAGLGAAVPLRRALSVDPSGAGLPGWWLGAGPGHRSVFRRSASALAADRSRIVLRLTAPVSANRDALGAKIVVTARDRNWAVSTVSKIVESRATVIGLDEAAAVESLEIVWPDRDRTRTRVEKLPIDCLIEIGPEAQTVRHQPLPREP